MAATRRLQLVAAEADMPVLLLRRRRGVTRIHSPSHQLPGRAGGSAPRLRRAWTSRVWEERGGRSNSHASVAVHPFP